MRSATYRACGLMIYPTRRLACIAHAASESEDKHVFLTSSDSQLMKDIPKRLRVSHVLLPGIDWCNNYVLFRIFRDLLEGPSRRSSTRRGH